MELEYLIRYTGSNGFLLLQNEHDFLFFTDGRYFEAYKRTLGEKVKLIPTGKTAYDILKDHLDDNTLYINSGFFSYQEVLDLRKKISPVKIRFSNSELSELRRFKNKKEYLSVQEAVRITEAGLAYLMAFLKEGVTEKACAVELEHYLKLHGAQELSFPAIVLFGENSALPHGEPGERKLKTKDVVLVDLGIKKDHICSDMTRTFCFGGIPDGFKEHYSFLLALQEETLRKIRPGIKPSHLDEELRQELSKKGLEGFYTHSLGHGVGTEVHEAPMLSYLRPKPLLQKGDLFTIEPGLYFPGLYGIRIEDLVYIHPHGKTEVLTTFPKEFLVVS